MSEHSKILEKYEKMFEDGSAYQPIHLNQPEPSIASITGAVEEKPDMPLGDQVVREEFMDDPHKDYTESDAYMQQRVDEIRNKRGNTTMHDNNQNVRVQNNGDYRKLEKRIEMLEQALTLVMETQTKLIKESK